LGEDLLPGADGGWTLRHKPPKRNCSGRSNKNCNKSWIRRCISTSGADVVTGQLLRPYQKLFIPWTTGALVASSASTDVTI